MLFKLYEINLTLIPRDNFALFRSFGYSDATFMLLMAAFCSIELFLSRICYEI